MKVFPSTNNLHIQDSYQVPKMEFRIVLGMWRELYPECLPLQKRSIFSLEMEWATHNFLYMLHIARERTKDVDLNYPQKWYERIGYAVFGIIALIFIK